MSWLINCICGKWKLVPIRKYHLNIWFSECTLLGHTVLLITFDVESFHDGSST